VTEAEWSACTDPKLMLEFLRSKASDRKLRLFAAACCRRVWDLLGDARSRQQVEAAEAYVDGQVTEHALEDTASGGHDGSGGPTEAAFWCCAEDYAFAADLVASQARRSDEDRPSDESRKAALLRDLFGNPFRPVALAAIWRTPGVLSLALAAYEGRQLPSGELDHARLAILADALEEAGCTDADLLGHLHGPGPHIRGCWAVDLLLGKA
jgi:hypothetical protein